MIQITICNARFKAFIYVFLAPDRDDVTFGAENLKACLHLVGHGLCELGHVPQCAPAWLHHCVTDHQSHPLCVWYLLSLWWMGLEMLKFIQRLQLLLLSSISPQAIEHVLRIMYNNNCLLVPYVVESSLKFLSSGAVCTLHMGIIYMLYYFTTHSIFNPAFIKFLNWFCQ